MATQAITLTRWTCDRCGVTQDNPEAGEDEIPLAWACVAVSADEVEPKTFDLCPNCTADLGQFLRGER